MVGHVYAHEIDETKYWLVLGDIFAFDEQACRVIERFATNPLQDGKEA